MRKKFSKVAFILFLTVTSLISLYSALPFKESLDSPGFRKSTGFLLKKLSNDNIAELYSDHMSLTFG